MGQRCSRPDCRRALRGNVPPPNGYLQTVTANQRINGEIRVPVVRNACLHYFHIDCADFLSTNEIPCPSCRPECWNITGAARGRIEANQWVNITRGNSTVRPVPGTFQSEWYFAINVSESETGWMAFILVCGMFFATYIYGLQSTIVELETSVGIERRQNERLTREINSLARDFYLRNQIMKSESLGSTPSKTACECKYSFNWLFGESPQVGGEISVQSDNSAIIIVLLLAYIAIITCLQLVIASFNRNNRNP